MRHTTNLFRLPRPVLILVVAMAAMIPMTVAAAPKSGLQCTKIAEHLSGPSVVELDENFNILSADISGAAFGGTVNGLNEVNKSTPGGVLHFTGLNVYTDTDFGTFSATTKGQVTPNFQLHVAITIVEGATGKFTTHGSFDPLTGNWELFYQGQICV
jgi:hypothetical protein